MFLASSFRLFFKIVSFCSPQLLAHTYLSIPYPLKSLPFTLFTSIPFYPPPPITYRMPLLFVPSFIHHSLGIFI